MSNCSEYTTFMNDTITLTLKREKLIHELIALTDEWNRARDYDEDDEEVDIIRADMDYVRRQIREIDALLAA